MAMKDLLKAVDPERVSATMRIVAGNRKRGWRICTVCGVTVDGLATRRYCSNACRQRAKYRRAHPDVQRPRCAAPPPGEPS